jgi:uncharacterized coiled-coil DUF342 family protein
MDLQNKILRLRLMNVVNSETVKHLNMDRKAAISKIETLRNKRDKTREQISTLTKRYNEEVGTLTKRYEQNKEELEQTIDSIKSEMTEVVATGSHIDGLLKEAQSDDEQLSDYDWDKIKDEWDDFTE